MSKTRIYAAWALAFAMLFLQLYISSTPAAENTEPVAEQIVSESIDPLLSEDTVTEIPEPSAPPAKVAVKKGLVEENGSLYYYNEYGIRFNGGLKEVVTETSTDYYYFLSTGQAFTSGYKTIQIDDVTCYYFFGSDGKAFTSGLKNITFGDMTYTYFFGEDGKAVTADWVNQNGTTYYFLDNGRAATDWFCAGDAYYYAPVAGFLSKNTVVHGYRLDAEGKSVTKYRINEYVKQHTDSSMTNQQKIDALYDWVLDNDMVYIRSYEHARADWEWTDGWVDDFATSQMDKQGGNCYRYSAFLGMLIREATGLDVKVYHGATYSTDGSLTDHGWPAVKQNNTWYIYDVELQKHSGVSSYDCYKVPADDSYMHLHGEATNLY